MTTKYYMTEKEFKTIERSIDTAEGSLGIDSDELAAETMNSMKAMLTIKKRAKSKPNRPLFRQGMIDPCDH